jgi:hypothetical protein
MGQGDSKLLSQQSELSRSYLVDGYQKEENLTMLTCRATLQQYLLREIICNDEQEYLRMIRKVSERKDMRSKFITQLESKGLGYQRAGVSQGGRAVLQVL